jgi:F-type H+-transporting ATPase subunit a
MVKENILNYNIKKLIVTISLLICAIFILPGDALAAADNHNHESEVVEEVEEKLDAGALILDHIMDSYEWHICTWKGKHISINLPIIVLSEGELYVFSSKHLHHGHEYVTLDRYGEEVRFKIPDSGKYEGKVVRFSSDDFLTRPLDFSITKTVFGLFVS